MTKFRSKIKSTFTYHNIPVSEQQCEQLSVFYTMLTEKNKVMNLTSITDEDEVIAKHFLDSCFLHKFYDLHRSVKICDIGTGAGFPGVPLKIVFPEIDITLVDSINKRLLFIDEVISVLGLENISLVHSRAEDFSHETEYRESYDLCVSRAVANLSTLSEYCLPTLKTNGLFVSYKSGEVEEEIDSSKKSLQLLGGRLENVYHFDYSIVQDDENSLMNRSFVFIKKIKSTPSKYPRKAGTPSKSPL